MPWYNSTIIGVLVGGFIGFGSATLRDYFENRRLKKRLKEGIKSEISVLRDFLQYSEKKLIDYKEVIDTKQSDQLVPGFEHFYFSEFTSKNIPLYEPLKSFRFYFLDNNIEKIGALDNSWIKPIIELRGISEITEKGIKIVFDTARKVKDFDFSLENHIIQVSQAINTFKHMKDLCDEILSLN